MSEFSLSAFLAMGGYGGYVWSAVAITAAIMVVNVVIARRSHRRMLAQLRRRAIVEEQHR